MLKLLDSLAFIFAFGCVGGWIIEFFYRHFVPSIGQTKKWVNPGFLSGPWLPLYGTGLSILYVMSFIELPGMKIDSWGNKILVLLIMVVVMTIIELITGYIFIIRLNMRLWDYSDNKYNFHGLICPLYTFFWGIICAIYYFIVHKPMLKFLDTLIYLPGYHIGVIIFYTLFILDFLRAIKILRLLKHLAKEFNIVVLFTAFRGKLNEVRNASKEESHFFRPLELKSLPMRTFFVKYKDAFTFSKLRDRLSQIKDRHNGNEDDPKLQTADVHDDSEVI